MPQATRYNSLWEHGVSLEKSPGFPQTSHDPPPSQLPFPAQIESVGSTQNISSDSCAGHAGRRSMLVVCEEKIWKICGAGQGKEQVLGVGRKEDVPAQT